MKIDINAITGIFAKLDELWFSYGNAIDDCIKDNDLNKVKKLLKEFYEKYNKLREDKTAQ